MNRCIFLLVTFSAVFHFASAMAACPKTYCASSTYKIDKHGNLIVKDICDVEGIQNNVSASYIVANDVDATCTVLWKNGADRGFTPIPGNFSGTLEGGGHWINGLYISSSLPQVGLFQTVSTGTVDNLAITNANMIGTTSGQQVGAVAGMNSGTISFAYVAGTISTAPSNLMALGGVAGYNLGTITLSYSAATIVPGSGDNNNAQYTDGGIVGLNSGFVTYSLAAGSVPLTSGDAGGLAGYSNRAITESAAVGLSTGSPNSSLLGGLVGWNRGGKIEQSYASGSTNSTNGNAGGLVELDDVSGSIDQSYAIGQTSASGGAGGLVDRLNGPVTSSYWDTSTTGQGASAAGVPFSTDPATGFLNAFPTDLDQSVWSWVAFTPGDPYSSFPYLIDFNCLYTHSIPVPAYCPASKPTATDNCPQVSGTSVPMYYCMLTQIQATFVPSLAQYSPSYLTPSGIYTYIPIGQLEDFQYSSVGNAETIDPSTGFRVKSEACLATVYAMLARIIGAIHSAAMIIDQYQGDPPNFCNATQPAYGAQVDCLLEQSNFLAFWPASLQTPVNYASFTPADKRLSLKNATDDLKAEAQLEAGHPLILHATVKQQGGGTTDHFILATSVYKAVVGDGTGLSPGTISRLVANDPEIGAQIFIDMNPNEQAYHYAVLSPAGPGDQSSYKALTAFAFKADSYKYVVLH